MIIATHIAGETEHFGAPEWPAPIRGTWQSLDADIHNPDAHSSGRLAAFGDFRFAVTQAELLAAANVATLLRAWRDLLDLANPTTMAEAPRLCAAIRQHLRATFNIKLGAPPPTRHLLNVATRATRRYDLLPPNMREVMP